MIHSFISNTFTTFEVEKRRDFFSGFKYGKKETDVYCNLEHVSYSDALFLLNPCVRTVLRFGTIDSYNEMLEETSVDLHYELSEIQISQLLAIQKSFK